MAKVRATGEAPFAVNLFAPVKHEPSRPETSAEAEQILKAFRAELGVAIDVRPPAVEDRFDAQLEAVLRGRPRVFSFTFGCLAPEVLRALQRSIDRRDGDGDDRGGGDGARGGPASTRSVSRGPRPGGIGAPSLVASRTHSSAP